MVTFDQRSESRLIGVKPGLVRVARAALIVSPVPFIVTEGLRSNERQAYLFASGKSRTLRSKHLTGDAIDVAAMVNGRVSWQFELYEAISAAFMDSASRLGVLVQWGGDWPKFRDGCHFELRPGGAGRS